MYCPECGAPIGLLAHRNGGPACHECETRLSTDDLLRHPPGTTEGTTLEEFFDEGGESA